MRKFNKYTKNLGYVDSFVYSYGNRVAVIDYKRCVLWVLDCCSRHTTTKHINYVAKELDLKVNQVSIGI